MKGMSCRPLLSGFLTEPISGAVWKTFSLFFLYPLHYWVIGYPSFVMGGRGLITTKAGQWQRTERTVDVTDATPKSSPRNKEIEREY